MAQYWLYLNNEKKGPFEESDLINQTITPETLVWREGLTEWIQAKYMPEMANYITNIPPVNEPIQPNPYQQSQYGQPQYGAAQPQYGSNQQGTMMPKPESYLWLSILNLLCCCQILGIIALVFSILSSNKYDAGKYDEAVSNANTAKILNFIGIGCGVIIVIICVIYYGVLAATLGLAH